MNFRIMRTACAVAMLCATGAGHAHDIVVFPSLNGSDLQVDVRYGHAEDWQQIAADKLYSFVTLAPDGSPSSWRKRLKLDGMMLKSSEPLEWGADAGVALFAAQYDNGYWSKNDADETVNTSRLIHPKSRMTSHNLKYGKALAATGRSHVGYDRVVGHKLELVPLADPFARNVGDFLPVAVRFNGRPLAGAGVEIGDSITAIAEDRIVRYKTDAKGVAQVPIPKAGWAVIGVDHEEKSPTPKLADKEKYTATLVFRLP